jgi:YEATS domain-containing protein 4
VFHPSKAKTNKLTVNVVGRLSVPAIQYVLIVNLAIQKLTVTVFGTEAQPFDPEKKPANAPVDHTHQWRIFVKGVNDEDISYWLKKVQFKLHETYAQSVRTIEQPPFEVVETGWGEFEIQVKLYFVPESNEKPQTLWHSLKLHPYGPDAEGMRERREVVVSQNYEEIVFNEPVEPFYEILTGGPSGAQLPRGKGKNAKQIAQSRTADIPLTESPKNPYARTTENREIDRLGEAIKTVEQMTTEEKERLVEREKRLAELRESEGVPSITKKR